MKIFLFLVGWVAFVAGLLALVDAATAIAEGVGAMILCASLVALGSAAICGRLEQLKPVEKPPANAWDEQLANAAAVARSPANAASKLPVVAP